MPNCGLLPWMQMGIRSSRIRTCPPGSSLSRASGFAVGTPSGTAGYEESVVVNASTGRALISFTYGLFEPRRGVMQKISSMMEHALLLTG